MAVISYDEKAGVLACELAARMATAESTEFSASIEAQLAAIAEQGRDITTVRIVLDMSAVEYVSSAFLRICVMLAKSVGKRNLSIVKTSPTVNKIFKMAGFDELLNVT